MAKKLVLIDADTLSALIKAATTYFDDLVTGLADGTYEDGDPEKIKAAIVEADMALAGNGPMVHIGVNIQGGVVQDVFGANIPVNSVDFLIIDYDTDGVPASDLSFIRQDDGTCSQANVINLGISLFEPDYFNNLVIDDDDEAGTKG